MARYLHLQVPTACHEQWQEMTPQHDGRFCQSCQKAVIDFTAMTDDELVRYFQQHDGPTCGRFKNDQLNRSMAMPSKPWPWLKYFLRYSLPAFLLMLKGNVEAQRVLTKIEVFPVNLKDSVQPVAPAINTVSGCIRDDSGLPLRGASVLVKGTGKGLATDSAGRFSFEDLPIPAMLEVSYVGFETKEIPITSSTQTVDLTLQLHPSITGDVVITMGYAIRPARRIKHKKTIEPKKQEVKTEPIQSVSVYPNPVHQGNSINLKCINLEKGDYKTEIYTLSGVWVQRNTISYAGDQNNMTLKIHQVKPGLYTLRLIHEKTGKQFSQQILVTE